MNYTKTRLRNRMQYELLESLLRIINYTNVNKTCCNLFQPDENMIKNLIQIICMSTVPVQMKRKNLKFIISSRFVAIKNNFLLISN